MKNLLIIVIFSSYLYANITYHFQNININYQNWLNNAQTNGNKTDFSYIGYEGGFGWNNGDFYGFFNLENPLKNYKNSSNDSLRYSGFFDTDITLDNNFKLHIQDFALKSYSYYVNDFIIGVAYKYTTNFGFWFRPFLGLHHTYNTYYNGFNGYMTGWLFNYETSIFSKKVILFNWNEIEFKRKKSFYQDENANPIGDGGSWGINGALSGWVYPLDNFAFGIQYRYAYQKLGSSAYQAAWIYTLKVYF